jgi:hypothetical protein
MRCQRRTRTPTVGVTVRRPSVRRSGIEYRDGESNPGLRVEGPASCPLDYRGMLKRKRGDSNAQRPRGPLPVFGTGSSSSRITSLMEPSVGIAPTTSSVPGTRSCSLSYKGRASPARLERATPAFGGRCSAPLSYGEVSVDDRSRTCTLRLRRPVPSPFGHVDVAPPANRRHGTRPGTRTQSVPG